MKSENEFLEFKRKRSLGTSPCTWETSFWISIMKSENEFGKRVFEFQL